MKIHPFYFHLGHVYKYEVISTRTIDHDYVALNKHKIDVIISSFFYVKWQTKRGTKAKIISWLCLQLWPMYGY